MNRIKTNHPESIEEIWAELCFHFYGGLMRNVIPSYRAITLGWNPGEPLAYLKFYHSITTNEILLYHDSSIETEATCTDLPKWAGKLLEFEVELYHLPLPTPIPKSDLVLFAFENEGIIPQSTSPYFLKNWPIQANIFLKFNETLVGRLSRALRLAGLNWQPESCEATIKFYHVGEISNKVRENYMEIYNLVRSISYRHKNKPLHFEVEIHSITEEEQLPEEGITRYLYWRAEPFVDPTE